MRACFSEERTASDTAPSRPSSPTILQRGRITTQRRWWRRRVSSTITGWPAVPNVRATTQEKGWRSSKTGAAGAREEAEAVRGDRWHAQPRQSKLLALRSAGAPDEALSGPGRGRGRQLQYQKKPTMRTRCSAHQEVTPKERRPYSPQMANCRSAGLPRGAGRSPQECEDY